MACASSGWPPIVMNGLGKHWRDAGQSLVPAPPERTTVTSFIPSDRLVVGLPF
jgi:hypothetical protein